MCPDRQILSLYFDGELPSPWKERFEAHRDACPDCGRQLAAWAGTRAALAADSVAVEALSREAGERVWLRLSAGFAAAEVAAGPAREAGVTGPAVRRQRNTRPTHNGFGYRPGRAGFLRRRLSIPLPAAAAAAALLVLAFALLARQAVRPGLPAAIPFAAGGPGGVVETPLPVPASSMSDVLRYLDEGGDGFTVINLPEKGSFASFGEPALRKAADYSRRRSGP